MLHYSVNGGANLSEGHSLIPAQQQSAWFDIEIAPNNDIKNKIVSIELEDQLGRKWLQKYI